MKLLTSTYTDVGIRKKTNQDSMLVMQAQSQAGPVLLAAICDGMGGLAKGEVASAAMAEALRGWFQTSLPGMIKAGITLESLRLEMTALVLATGKRIAEYGAAHRVELGTTAVVLLIVGDRYYTMNVGDSRVYLISDNIYQLTKDQTYVQREMDLGKMTPEQAQTHPQRNVLLQCVGASSVVQPDYTEGKVLPEQIYMLCCDGFRHLVQPQEFFQALNPGVLKGVREMEKASVELVNLNMSRGESDNISVILVKTQV